MIFINTNWRMRVEVGVMIAYFLFLNRYSTNHNRNTSNLFLVL